MNTYAISIPYKQNGNPYIHEIKKIMLMLHSETIFGEIYAPE